MTADEFRAAVLAKPIAETQCQCVDPSPIAHPWAFNTSYVVLCRKCGKNLMHRCLPTSSDPLAAMLCVELERLGDACLTVPERVWVQERRAAVMRRVVA